MPITYTFDVAASPARVFAFLSDPRNHFVANNDGPVVASSDAPIGVGSWFIVAFDQLRARIEYPVYEPDRRITVSIVLTGRGSGGGTSTCAYVLTDLGGAGTRIEATADGSGGLIRWGPVVRASRAMSVRRLRARIQALA